MLSKETEQTKVKVAEVKAEMAALKKALKENKKNLEEVEQILETKESTELFHSIEKVSGKSKADKSVDDVFIKAAEQTHPHLDVSPGDHTVVDYEVLHPHTAKSVKA